MNYDLVIIGGGPAGYLAAERAGHAGLCVLLIEKRYLGGVCLNEGCIPSKTFLHSAKIYDYAKHGAVYGVEVEHAVFHHKTVLARKEKIVKTLTSGIRNQLTKSKITVVEGKAEILTKTEMGFSVRVNDIEYTGTHLLIATGSVPIIPRLPGLEEGMAHGMVLTNREILDLPDIPASLAIIGGGVIGLEMASYFNSAGCQVTVIEMLDRIASGVDREIAELLRKDYEKKGVRFKLLCKVTAIEENTVIIEGDHGKESIAVEKVLLSIGRKPAIDGLGLERIGVYTERGRIVTDDKGRTNIPQVYAAGDVNGRSMLAHTAYREAEVCVNTMLGKADRMRYHAIPMVLYTNPEVAGVGETEDSAREKGLDTECVTIPMRFSGRYLAENEGGGGICKLIIDKRYRRLVGFHMVANYASEIIFGVGLMIEAEYRVDDLKELVFPHPTVGEVIRDGLFQF